MFGARHVRTYRAPREFLVLGRRLESRRPRLDLRDQGIVVLLELRVADCLFPGEPRLHDAAGVAVYEPHARKGNDEDDVQGIHADLLRVFQTIQPKTRAVKTQTAALPAALGLAAAMR